MEQKNFVEFKSAVNSNIHEHLEWLLKSCNMPKKLAVNCVRDELKEMNETFVRTMGGV